MCSTHCWGELKRIGRTSPPETGGGERKVLAGIRETGGTAYLQKGSALLRTFLSIPGYIDGEQNYMHDVIILSHTHYIPPCTCPWH